MPDIRHAVDFAQTLHHGVVVEDDLCVVFADEGQRVGDALWQIETRTRPISRKVLCPAVDRSIRFNDAGTTDADEGRKLELRLFGAPDDVGDHLDERAHGGIARNVVRGVAPDLAFRHGGIGKAWSLLQVERDEPDSHVGPADIHCDEGVMALEDPLRRELDGAQEARVVRIAVDGYDFDINFLGLEQGG